jgi:type I restriction enzyme M protein
LEKQCKTVQDRKVLQEKSIQGGEAKPLPYMLSQMNLLLHGLNAPAIEYGNSLAVKITELGHADQVDVILTNPPFGGQEERGILSNFPADLQTSETALLFLQLILRRLAKKDGRAAIVVPDGFLSNLGVASRVKRELLTECNLHTIIRLPFGVFEPYTPIKTNLLFFSKPGPTTEVWFYDVPIADGRKKYTKTRPLTLEELAECRSWWKSRRAGPNSWKVKVKQIIDREYSLDFRNPAAVEDEIPNSPTELATLINEDAAAISNAAVHLAKLVAKWEAAHE